MKAERTEGIGAGIGPSAFVGFVAVLISLAHVPAAWEALNYFDPPKRLLWAFAALALAAMGCGRASRLGRGPIWLALGLLLWMGIRTACRAVPAAEIEVLCAWTLPLLMLILGSDARLDAGRRVVGVCLLAAGLLQAVFMLLQRAGWDPLFAATTSAMSYAPGRMVGTIGYHNQAVDFVALSGVGVFMLTPFAAGRMAAWLPVVAIAVLAGNRGGILAFGAALVASQLAAARIAADRRRYCGAGIALLAIMAAIVVALPATRARFEEVVLHFRESPAVASRWHMARVGLDMFAERPWIGWGAGEYALQYLERLGAILPEAKSHALLRTVFFAREAHNDGLQFAAEFGLVGVLLAAGLLVALVLRLVRLRRTAPAMAAPLAYVLCYMAVAGLFSFPWQASMAGPLAGFLVGWLWPRDPAAAPPRPRRWLAAILASAAAGMLLWCGWDAFLNVAVPARLAAGDPAAAERLLSRADYRCRALVGAAYAAQGRWVEAEQALDASQKGYRDVLSWNNLNHVHAQQGQWAQAVSVCEKWMRCGLIHSNALQNLSIAYENVGRFSEAAEMLGRRMEMWSICTPPEVERLAVLWLRAGDPLRARDALYYFRRRWVAADSRTVAELENLTGAANLAAGDPEEARKWFESALARNPELESARRNLAGLAGNAPGSAAERPAE